MGCYAVASPKAKGLYYGTGLGLLGAGLGAGVGAMRFKIPINRSK